MREYDVSATLFFYFALTHSLIASSHWPCAAVGFASWLTLSSLIILRTKRRSSSLTFVIVRCSKSACSMDLDGEREPLVRRALGGKNLDRHDERDHHDDQEPTHYFGTACHLSSNEPGIVIGGAGSGAGIFSGIFGVAFGSGSGSVVAGQNSSASA